MRSLVLGGIEDLAGSTPSRPVHRRWGAAIGYGSDRRLAPRFVAEMGDGVRKPWRVARGARAGVPHRHVRMRGLLSVLRRTLFVVVLFFATMIRLGSGKPSLGLNSVDFSGEEAGGRRLASASCPIPTQHVYDGQGCHRTQQYSLDYNTHSNFVIKNVTFQDSASAYNGPHYGDGGAVHIADIPGTVASCTFLSNSADNDGGAIYVASSVRFTVASCTFLNNNAAKNGGGVFLKGDSSSYWSSTVASCTFLTNIAGDSGGGVFVKGSPSFDTLISCLFRGNKARDDGSYYPSGEGGALYFRGGTVASCTFLSNEGVRSGGGAFINSGSSGIVTISLCLFHGNTVVPPNPGLGDAGGGLNFDSFQSFDSFQHGTVASSTFLNNEADFDGGGVHIGGTYSAATLTSCMFQENVATGNFGPGIGGAFYVANSITGSLTGTVESCSFLSNRAYNKGGGVHALLKFAVSSCVFLSNQADSMYGKGAGGIYDDLGSGITITSTSFIYNSGAAATWGAGAILYKGPGTVHFCTFFSNLASGSTSGAINFCQGDEYSCGNAHLMSCVFMSNTGFSQIQLFKDGSNVLGNVHFLGGPASAHELSERARSGSVTAGYSKACEKSYPSFGGGIAHSCFAAQGDMCSPFCPEGKACAVFPSRCQDPSTNTFTPASELLVATLSIKVEVRMGNAQSQLLDGLNCDGTALTLSSPTASGDGSACGVAVNQMLSATLTSSHALKNLTIHNTTFAGARGKDVMRLQVPAKVSHCTFFNNSNPSGGLSPPVFFEADAVVEHCTFLSNLANSNGAALYFQKRGTVVASTFMNEAARGAFFKTSGVAKRCAFIANQPGAVKFDSIDASSLIASCSFLSNGGVSVTEGGALYININQGGGVTVSVSMSSFVSNAATSKAGGIYWAAASTGTSAACFVENCTFQENTTPESAPTKGGGMYFVSRAGNVTNSVFSSNRARNGGGIYFAPSNPSALEHLVKGVLENCHFRGNSAGTGSFDSCGGGVHDDELFAGRAAPRGIASCSFANNTLSGSQMVPRPALGGGGIYCTQDSVVVSCEFRSNEIRAGSGGYGSKWYGGGGIYFKQDGVVVSCIFDGNAVGDGFVDDATGGGIHLSRHGINASVVSTSSFHNNFAAMVGGGIYFKSSSSNAGEISIAFCFFESNTVLQRGGAVFFEAAQHHHDKGRILSSAFVGNSAQFYEGGAMYVTSGAKLSNCSFLGNTAFGGGAIHISQTYGTTAISTCTFESNTVKSSGGALYVYKIAHDTESSITLTSCMFVGNIASVGGSVLYILDPSKLHLAGLNIVAGGHKNAFVSPNIEFSPNLTAVVSCPAPPTSDASGYYLTTSGNYPRLQDFLDEFYGCPLLCAAGRRAVSGVSSTAEETQCVDCTEGRYSDRPRSPTCDACPTGQYHNLTRANSRLECKECGAERGIYYSCSNGGRHPCLEGSECPSGKTIPCGTDEWQNETGRSTCKTCTVCTAGTKLATPCTRYNDTICAACDIGQYQTLPGKLSCSNCAICPVGKQRKDCGGASTGICENCDAGVQFKDSVGADYTATCANCSTCSNGKYIEAACTVSSDTSCGACKVCPAGKVRKACTNTSSGGYCEACPVDTFKDSEGQDFMAACAGCSSCPQGTYELTPCNLTANTRCGTLSCTTCGSGEYMVPDSCTGANPGSCQECNKGKYLSIDESEAACKACPKGWAQNRKASMACDRCPSGTIQPDEESETCVACQPGRYQAPNETCAGCPQGFFQTVSGKALCLPCVGCAAGKYRKPGTCTNTSNTECESCEGGAFLNATSGQCSPCKICRRGKYINAPCNSAENTRCDTCATCEWGKYLSPGSCNSTKFSAGTCEPCVAGATYMEDAGSCTPCSTCPEGKYVKTACTTTSDAVCDTMTCITCAPGTYRENGTCTKSFEGVCATCPSGQIAPQNGALRCTPCPDGTYATTASEPCANCPVGYESLMGGQALCRPCESCPAGTFNTDLSTCGNCANCPAGFAGTEAGSCRECKSSESLGAYQPAPGKRSCLQCSTNAIDDKASFEASENGTVCECADGYRVDASKVNTGSANLACTICDTNRELCCQAFGSPFLRNRAGFWASPSTPGLVLACPVVAACNGLSSKTATCADAAVVPGQANASKVCAQGHTGLACTQCAPNFKPASDGACVFCDTALDDATVVIAQLAIYWAATFLICSGIFFFGSSSASKHKEEQSLLSQEATVIVSFCQVAASFGYTFSSRAGGGQDGMVLPPRVTAVCSWLAAGSVDFLALLKDIASPCTLAASFRANLTVRLFILPVLVSAAAAAHILVSSTCQRTRDPRAKAQARNAAVALANLLIFCLWPSAGGTLVRPFVCVDVGEMSLVAGDLAVRCDFGDPRYASMVTLSVIGLVCITIGIPCAYFVVLRRQDLGSDQTKERFGALYEKYERKYYYWELVVMLYKFCMASVVLVLRRAPAVQFVVAMFVGMGYTFLVAKLQPYEDNSVDLLDQFVMLCTLGVLLLGYVNTYSFRDQQRGGDAIENLCFAVILLACLGCVGALIHTVLEGRYPCQRLTKKDRVKVLPVATASAAAVMHEQHVEEPAITRLTSVRASRSQERRQQQQLHSSDEIRRVLTRVHAMGDADLAGETSLAEAEQQKAELVHDLEEFDKAELVDMLLTDYREEHARAKATEAELVRKLDEEHKHEATLQQELAQMKRRATSKHLEKAADEVEAKRIMAEHEAEHEQHRAQLLQEQRELKRKASARRERKRMSHVVAALHAEFEGLEDDAIMGMLDKDGNGIVDAGELFATLQTMTLASGHALAEADAAAIMSELGVEGEEGGSDNSSTGTVILASELLVGIRELKNEARKKKEQKGLRPREN